MTGPETVHVEQVGRTGVHVTELGLGTAQLGDLYRRSSDREACEIVDAAWEAGIRYFDTAPYYGLGLAERRLGHAIRGYARSEFVLSSKVGRVLSEDDPTGYRWDYSARGVRESLEQSLDRLGTTHVDIALIHDPQGRLDRALEEALPALEELKHDGVIGAIGVGSGVLDAHLPFAETGRVDVLMVAGRYTLLEQPAADRLFPLCEVKGISVLNAGVFNSGLLAADNPGPGSRYEYVEAPSESFARARELAALARRHGTSLPQAALAFAAAPSCVASVVVGADSADQVTRNADLFRTRSAAVGMLEHLQEIA
jgi:D-threo-aldose 1-dehydrogenase